MKDVKETTGIMQLAKEVHIEMARMGIKHIFIIEVGEDEPRVGGFGDFEWQSENLVKATKKIYRLFKK
jgi:hypothetical protein